MVLVEQYPLVRAVMRKIVEGQPDVDIVAEAADVDDAIGIIRDETELPVSLVVPAVRPCR